MHLPWAAQVALVMAACAAVLLPSLGAAPLERAEIYFMDGARGMVESGDWLVPRYQGAPFFDKPALTYWLMAASFSAFGTTLGAGRLVSAGAALALLATTAWLGRLVLDRRAALHGTLALGTTLLVLSFGRVAMSDMLLSLWCTLAVGVGVRAATTGGGPGSMALLGAVLGLGFLTKGPIAVVLAGLGLALLAGPGLRGARLRPRWTGAAAAMCTFVVCGLGWFAVVGWRLGPGPLEYFFFRENLARFAGEVYDAGRSPLFYLWAYLAAGLPWSLLFPLAAWRGRRRGSFLLLWMALMAVALSLSRGKIDYYLLPLLPPASLVIGSHLRSRWDAIDRSWARGALLAFALVALLPAAMEARLPTDWLPGWRAQVGLVALGAGVAAAAALAALRPSPVRLSAVFAGGTAVTFTFLAAVFLPAFRAAQPNADVVEDVRRERAWRPDAALVVCGDPARTARDLLFEVRVVAQERCDVWNPASSRRPFLLLVAPEQWQALQTVPGIREVATYRSVPAAALTLGDMIAGIREEPFVLVANYPTDDPVAETKRRRDRKRALRREAAAAP
ncbi:MAG TPA: glycosyltransferase family 39 protein [Vicinamibacteria bacterium]|nr:glycosyltransferase family 39 protein [Vicinamibacteria bacterium]